MIKIVAKMTVKEDKIEAFKDLAKELVAKSSAEEGNAGYTLNQNISDPKNLTFIEYWKDQEAIEIHNASEHFTRILPQLAVFCEDEGDIALYQEVEF